MPDQDPFLRFEHERANLLPPELAAFLKDQHYAALLHATDLGTVLLIKSPTQDIESVRGRVPIGFNHELYDHPASPVDLVDPLRSVSPRSRSAC